MSITDNFLEPKSDVAVGTMGLDVGSNCTAVKITCCLPSALHENTFIYCTDEYSTIWTLDIPDGLVIHLMNAWNYPGYALLSTNEVLPMGLVTEQTERLVKLRLTQLGGKSPWKDDQGSSDDAANL